MAHYFRDTAFGKFFPHNHSNKVKALTLRINARFDYLPQALLKRIFARAIKLNNQPPSGHS
jgi:hypothetical protein